MRAARKFTTCVDCQTPVIGDQIRCAACHERYFASLRIEITSDPSDEDATVPRERERERAPVVRALATWLVVAQLFAIVVILLILAGRGCQ